MKIHPFAEMMPRMSEEEFTDLKKSIAQYGQRELIVTYKDTIIDGRHRWDACFELGIEPKTTEYEGPEDEASLLAFVLDLNVNRRHLSNEQKREIFNHCRDSGVWKKGERGQMSHLPNAAIAKKLGVDDRTIKRWDAEREGRGRAKEEDYANTDSTPEEYAAVIYNTLTMVVDMDWEAAKPYIKRDCNEEQIINLIHNLEKIYA